MDKGFYRNPDDLFKDAEKKGIIKLNFDEVDVKGTTINRVVVFIADPKRWMNFLKIIRNNTKNKSELDFVSGLLSEFQSALDQTEKKIFEDWLEDKDGDKEWLKEKEPESAITDEKIQKLNKISTVEQLLESFKEGEL